MNLAIIGPSGAGKGTQIDMLVASFGLVHFCPGNLFREHVKKRTALGLLAQKYTARGKLVPDEIVEAMVEEWLWLTDPGQGIIFDGFPRTSEQAKFLDQVFGEVDRTVDAVFYLEVSEELALKRLLGRRICKVCAESFHDESDPFVTCPYGKCQGEHLYHTDEDQPEMIRNRLAVFNTGIGPVLDYYRSSAKLITFNAEESIENVHKSILKEIETRNLEKPKAQRN